MKPTIGISCSLWAKKEEWVHQEGKTFDHLKREYYQLAEQLGGVPVLLPNVDNEATIGELLDRIDGLILSGGDDVDPSFYGEPNRFPKSIIHPHRDRVEIALARGATERKKAVLGICRGIQLLNVAFGGSLWQDTMLRPNTNLHNGPDDEPYMRHTVRLAPGTHLHALAGGETATIVSRHHQHLNRLAKGFIISATAPDGVIEGIERLADGQYTIGVQWHPESLSKDPFSRTLFADFIAASARIRTT